MIRKEKNCEIRLKFEPYYYTDEDGYEVIDESDALKMFNEIWELRLKRQSTKRKERKQMNYEVKAKILDKMLKKGYIDEKKHQGKMLDENFSEYDAAIYYHIEEAYADADNGNYTREDFKKKYAKWLQL